VKSLDLDTWNEKQLNFMTKGGNQRLRSYFGNYLFPDNWSLDIKYRTKAGTFYRD